MMPTVGRLKTRPQFLKVAATRRKWVTPGLVLQAARRSSGNDRTAPAACANPEEPEAEVRVGFTVTRKVGNAVQRNRAKRRLRAAAAEVFAEHGRPGSDYVVIGRVATLTRPYDALRRDLEQAILNVERPSHGPGKGRSRGHGRDRATEDSPRRTTARKEGSQ